MGSPTNRDRAAWVESACVTFAEQTGQEWSGGGEANSDDQQEIIGDLLADLMHLCDFNQLDFCAAVSSGSHHYRAERTEEYPASLLVDESTVSKVKSQVTALAEVVASDQKAQQSITDDINRRLTRLETTA